MIMVAMSYFCRQNMSQISLEIVANCSHPSEILALKLSVCSGTIATFELIQTDLPVFSRR